MQAFCLLLYTAKKRVSKVKAHQTRTRMAWQAKLRSSNRAAYCRRTGRPGGYVCVVNYKNILFIGLLPGGSTRRGSGQVLEDANAEGLSRLRHYLPLLNPQPRQPLHNLHCLQTHADDLPKQIDDIERLVGPVRVVDDAAAFVCLDAVAVCIRARFYPGMMFNGLSPGPLPLKNPSSEWRY